MIQLADVKCFMSQRAIYKYKINIGINPDDFLLQQNKYDIPSYGKVHYILKSHCIMDGERSLPKFQVLKKIKGFNILNLKCNDPYSKKLRF